MTDSKSSVQEGEFHIHKQILPIVSAVTEAMSAGGTHLIEHCSSVVSIF